MQITLKNAAQILFCSLEILWLSNISLFLHVFPVSVLLQALGLDVRHLSALVLLSRSFSFSLCWRSFSLFFAHLDGMISPEWYHDVMISLCSLFFFSLFVSVLASYKCVRDSNTHRSSYDRSPVHSAPDHLFLLLSFVSRSFLLSNNRFRGLASYRYVSGLFNSHYPIQQCFVLYWMRNNIWSFQSVSTTMYWMKLSAIFFRFR